MKYSSLVNDIVVKTWSSGRFAPRLNHHLKGLLTLEVFIGINNFWSHVYATRYFGKLNELPKQALVSENCGNKQLYKLHLAKNEMMFFWLDMLGKHTCAFVMNIKFMMEFTISHSKLWKFPLRLSQFKRDRRPNLQPKSTSSQKLTSLLPLPGAMWLESAPPCALWTCPIEGRENWLMKPPCLSKHTTSAKNLKLTPVEHACAQDHGLVVVLGYVHLGHTDGLSWRPDMQEDHQACKHRGHTHQKRWEQSSIDNEWDAPSTAHQYYLESTKHYYIHSILILFAPSYFLAAVYDCIIYYVSCVL